MTRIQNGVIILRASLLLSGESVTRQARLDALICGDILIIFDFMACKKQKYHSEMC